MKKHTNITLQHTLPHLIAHLQPLCQPYLPPTPTDTQLDNVYIILHKDMEHTRVRTGLTHCWINIQNLLSQSGTVVVLWLLDLATNKLLSLFSGKIVT